MNTIYTLGIDIGSTTSKCAILKDGEELVATSLQRGGLGTGGPEEALAELWEKSGLSREKMDRVIATGYGRKKFSSADGEVSELTCHAMGGRFIFPDLRTVIDIGGQDAKIISLTADGKMSNFIMNDKCAAGTGRFLEVMANILCLDIDQLGVIAAQSDKPAPISNTCTVFAESEVISQMANGVERADLVAGICQSVATRVASLARRAGVTPRVCMSGSVARNESVRRYMAEALGVEIAYDPLAQHFGAIGAAFYGWRQANQCYFGNF